MSHVVCPRSQLRGSDNPPLDQSAPCYQQIYLRRKVLVMICRIQYLCSSKKNHHSRRSLRTLETGSSTGKVIRSRGLALCRCMTFCRCDVMLLCASSLSISSKRRLYASRRRRGVLLDDYSQVHRVRRRHLQTVHLWPVEDNLNPRAYCGSKGAFTSSTSARLQTHPSRE